MPEISIIIPLYNKATYIKRAIDSVLAQTEQNFEIIVINDASTDGSDKIVSEINDSRISLINRTKPSAGGYAARNTGISNAKATLLAFLDADDAWEPKFLDTIFRLQNKFPQAGIYATAYKIQEPSGKTIVPIYDAIPTPPWEGMIPNYFESVLGPPPVCSSAVAIPKRVFTEIGLFYENAKGEDLNMWLRIALKHPIAFSNTVNATYYRDAINRVSNDKKYVQEYGTIKTIRENLTLSNNLTDKDRLFLTEYSNLFVISSAAQMIAAGRPGVAKAMLSECKTIKFRKRKNYWYFWAHMPVFITKMMIGLKKYLSSLLKN